MTSGERAALDALEIRLGHVAATAKMLARDMAQDPQNGVLEGIAETLNEVRARIELLLDPPSPSEATH